MQTLKFEKRELTGILTISRPESLNALNSTVLSELAHFLDNIEKDPTVKCLILRGDGEKAFVAGADIKELSDLNSSEALRFAERGQKIFRRLEVLNMPVIAAVNGFALGGGCELALACDFIVATRNARFGLPEVSLGLIPGFGGTQRLSRLVGVGRARELIYSGRHVRAEEALDIGLVTQVVEPESLLDASMQLAKLITTRGPLAVGTAKQAIRRGMDVSLDEGLMIERELFSDLFRTSDQKEGTKAFIEKRTPQFTGK